ncbi:Structural maintenance of chromosomes protein 4 [Sphaceloma murrayae]|uniref:Structural maintenance of chromosomes protein 4 n=1 Tax=Sphaceloma murrayae TaxID=2082308 RepID=A0A2K1QWD9_9PEZI|nr:Structural maintenance of chromosomes protein 4 [Sphaceloma murrayae]
MLPKTLLLLPLLPSALAVSLADFAPRASSLPSACQSVYTANIPMCQPSDFEKRKCSKDCVNALNALRASVSKACRGVTGQNILAALMAGRGTQDLCPNSGDYDDDDDDDDKTSTYASAPASTPTTTTTTPSPPPSSATTTTQPPSPSSTATSAPQTPSSSSSSPSSTSSERTTVVFATNTVVPLPSGSEVPTSIIFDSNTPTEVAATATRTATRSAAATTVNNGGSPFSSEPGMESLNGGAAGLAVHTGMMLAAVGGVVLLAL